MGAGQGPFEVLIEDIGAQGDGVARPAGAGLFVPMALPARIAFVCPDTVGIVLSSV